MEQTSTATTGLENSGVALLGYDTRKTDLVLHCQLRPSPHVGS